MACLARKEHDNHVFISESHEYSLWDTPDRFYQPSYKADEKAILLLTADEYENANEPVLFETGKKVYSDNYYVVYEFENRKQFEDIYFNK